MTPLDDPREQLRVIRSLMERATIYRALSAPTALVGGLLSLGALGVAWQATREGGLAPGAFIALWLGVLLVTSGCNAYFLWRGAVGRGETFFSPGMKTALVSVAPAFIAAGIFTVVDHRPIDLSVAWIVLYGLGLLGTQHFAPRSLAALGWVFVAAGCVVMAAFRQMLFVPSWPKPSAMPDSSLLAVLAQGPAQQTALLASGVMAGTFGVIHLLYAAAVWLRGEERRAIEA